jgi:mRNA-degrading endonuclease RelE of RelBE toxin-antitoxin system
MSRYRVVITRRAERDVVVLRIGHRREIYRGR